MSEIKVNSVKGVGATNAAITINNTDGTCTANITNRSNRNLVINGNMQIAQRATSSTSTGYETVDRFRTQGTGLDENPTQAQVDVASGSAPYNLGFRKAFKVTNGNQSSGAAAGDILRITMGLEAQTIDESGWNVLSTTSYVTVSFWVRSSVSQRFYLSLINVHPAANKNYVIDTGVLSANTWTKVTSTIPGNSILDFSTGVAEGLRFEWNLYRGTDSTGSVSLNAWADLDATARVPDMTSTWFTTDNATFELTGVQLEVGSTATDFEFISFAENLRACRRYCYAYNVRENNFIGNTSLFANSTTQVKGAFHFPVPMRTYPTYSADSFNIRFRAGNSSANFNANSLTHEMGDDFASFPQHWGFNVVTSSITGGQAGLLQGQANGQIRFEAEV